MTAVIFNPAAGRGRISQEQLEARLSQFAEDAPFRVYGTPSAAQIAPTVENALARGARVVAVAGGDGTLGAVAGVVQKRAILGVLPLGTGNDFARSLGIGTDLNAAIQTLFRGRARLVDAGRATLDGHSHLFLNIAGCGFDSKVARRINAGRFHPFWRHWKGTAAYGAAVALELGSLKSTNLRLELDGETIERRALLCAVANANSYGGGMKVAPDAALDDGLFDVCLLREAGKWEFARAFLSVFRGEHIHHPKVEIWRARRVEVESEPPLPVLVDGEIRGQTPVSLEIVPRAVRIMAPIAAAMQTETR